MNVRVASLAVAPVAAAGLCVAAPTATAAPVTAAPASAQPADITYCPYQVNGTGVRVRSSPKIADNVIGSVAYHQKGLASQNTYSGSGLSWRKGFGGYVAAEYLTRISGSCAQ